MSTGSNNLILALQLATSLGISNNGQIFNSLAAAACALAFKAAVKTQIVDHAGSSAIAGESASRSAAKALGGVSAKGVGILADASRIEDIAPIKAFGIIDDLQTKASALDAKAFRVLSETDAVRPLQVQSRKHAAHSGARNQCKGLL